MPSDLRFRSDYASAPDGRRELKKLLFDVFELDISPLDRLGHDPSVVTFGWWADDLLVANVSLYERRLWLAGSETKAFGVQSVAVRPEWRGQGLFRDLMNRALGHADARASLVELGTETPDLYTGFGFRRVEETCFTGVVAAQPSHVAPRLLTLDDDDDVALLRDLFRRRTPTSWLAAACDHPALFCLKAVATPAIDLVHLPALDAVVAVQDREAEEMTVLDVVAQSMPSLAEIASALHLNGRSARVCLTPDRLAWTPTASEAVDTGYMVRGPFAPEGQPFMLSDMVI